MSASNGKAKMCKTCAAEEEAETKRIKEQKAEELKKRKEEEVRKEEARKKHEELQRSQEEEIQQHNLGRLLMAIGIVLCAIPCFMHGGTTPVVIGGIGFILLFAGIILWANNRSAAKIKEDHQTMEAMFSYVAKKADAGQSITKKDVDLGMSVMGLDTVEKHNQAKKDAVKIAKGAVVGGVVAGETGAVIGAVMAKNKIDNEKNNE